ncbi:MAG: aminoglycoside phosphotransferase family protein [Anaerolineales bacterium]|nr:aminoglycoside phosphotransferase family protein [Anaerolineales bacterium]
MDDVLKVAEEFVAQGTITNLREYGSGNINDTYLVSVNSGVQAQFILQRINTHVFNRPEWIIRNMRTFGAHMQQKLQNGANGSQPRHTTGSAKRVRHWEIPIIRPTRSQQDFHIDGQGSFWRAISFIAASRSYDTVQSENHAREAGYALGQFQSLVSDLDPGLLHDTLVGFHITPHYLAQYDATLATRPPVPATPEVRYCHNLIAKRRAWIPVLEEARTTGKLKVRTIHGDPKINNIMISDWNGQAISVVDLDTVKPGLVHYDIGDCLRSSCNPLGEETTDFEHVRFETDLAYAILDGYFSVAYEFLEACDYHYLYDAIRLLTFELGLRFFADYLAGNVYFKIRHPEHNLERAMVQFKLTESIEVQENSLRKIIADLQPVLI